MTDTIPAWPTFDSGDDDIETLAKLSRYYGQYPRFVIAGGGNTSVKNDKELHVKASGSSLANIGRDGFVALDRAQLQQLCERQLATDAGTREEQFKQALLQARLEPAKGQRPSVESLLHHLLPAKFVVHSHAPLVNAVTCASRGPELARELFGDEALWIPFVDPGYVLGRTLMEMITPYVNSRRQVPKIILMANHGLIVQGDTPEEIRHTTERLMSRVAARLSAAKEGLWPETRSTPATPALINRIAPALRGLLADTTDAGTLKVVAFDDSPVVSAFLASEAARQLPQKGPLNPDQIVYCNSFPLYVELSDESDVGILETLRVGIASHRNAHGYLPRVVLVRGVGLFGIGDDYKTASAARDLYKDAIEILAGAERLGGATYMSDGHRKFIEEWEVEAYRKQVSAGAGGKGRAARKVAVVTGAAQGFGLEIAQALAAEGASVAMCDVNADGAHAAAAELNKTHGGVRAIGLKMDVTRGESIAAALHQVVRTYGGFDLFISNAGVLKAESVKTQSETDFDLVTAVNYRGFFLCVQQAAGILATQRRSRPDYKSDIIQINSKSGLEGSNKNGAYAGSKFGGIGLTQSFALELIADGIKVNAICPGNFFDGPLWSDPQNGLFAQYLRTGKVPGAKTADDVRKFYEAKVPMGRGCNTADVMKAIFYVMEQQYETGQAIPVTGGQVMLS